MTEGTATCSITTDSTVIGAVSIISFQITPTHAIPALGGLEITLPKWSENGESMVADENSYNCQITTPASSSPGGCSITTVSGSSLIKVTSMINTAIAVGTVLTFQFQSIKNPPLADPYTISIRTLEANGLGIDRCSPTLKVTTPNVITYSSSTVFTCANNRKINTDDTCTLTVRTTNPLPINSVIVVKFPSEVILTSLTNIREEEPNFSASVTFTNSLGQVSLTNAISTYQTGPVSVSLRFTTIRHPSTTKPTSPFQITTFMNGNAIDTITSGITYSASTGTISSVTITGDPTDAGSSSSLTFSFQVENDVTAASTLRIVFPNSNEFPVSDNPSTSCEGTGPKMVASPLCSILNNILTVTNYAASTITYTDTVKIKLNNIILPTTTKPTSSKFDIRTQQDGYDVDRNNLIGFTATVAAFTAKTLTVATGALVAGISGYTITLTNKNPIPATGKFKIIFPTDNKVSISDINDIQTSSQVTIGGAVRTPSIAADTSSTSPILTFTNPLSALIPSGTSIIITLPALNNPPSTASTSSFTVTTLTSDNFDIDTTTTGLNVAANAISPSPFQSATMTSSIYTTGSQAVYTFLITPKVSHSSTSILVINFPNEVSFQSPTCQALAPVSMSSFSCVPSSKQLTITFGQSVNPLQTFKLQVSGVTNPTSEGRYSTFSVLSKVSTNVLVHQTMTAEVYVDITASIITDATLTRDPQVLGAAATFTFSFTPKNSYPTTAYIEVIVPSELIIPSSSLTCRGIQGMSTTVSCAFKSGTDHTIHIMGGGAYDSTKISFSIASINNPTTQTDTSSFQIFIRDSSDVVIEKLTSGLSALSACNANCKTCVTNNRDVCTSCNNQLLNIVTSKCVNTCGSNTYEDTGAGQCKQCNSRCQDCTGSSNTQCTACYTASTSSFPYYYNSQCLSSCPGGYYADGSKICQPCVGNCATCSSAAVCITCNSDTFFLNGQCSSVCQDGYYPDASQLKCQQCKSNCLTCSSLTQCLSCNSASTFPILYNSDCINACPDGTFLSDNTCKPCLSPCTTCTLSESNCLSCDASSTKPLFYANQCYDTCPTEAPVIVNRNCVKGSTTIPDDPDDSGGSGNTTIIGRVNPYNGLYRKGLPFPFVIFALIFSVFAYIGRMVSDLTLVVSNIIGFFSLLELATWITLGLLLPPSHPDDDIGDYIGLPIVLIGLVTYLILNIIFYFMAIRPVVKAEEFVTWKKQNRKHRVISILMQTLSFVSFKSFRLLYSRFFGLEYLSAPLSDKKSYLKLLHKFTGVNFFVSVLPALIAAIITIHKDNDFSQLLNISIEILLISLATMGLSIYDAIKPGESELSATNTILGVANAKVFSMLEKSIMEKLNESMESSRKGDMKKLGAGKFNAHRKRNSLNLDSSYEYHESNTNELDGSSFMHLNPAKAGGRSGDMKKTDDSFSDLPEGHPGRDLQFGDDFSKIEAIEEIEKEDDDDEPTLNMNSKTIGKLRDTLRGQGSELKPQKIVIENKDGSVVVLRENLTDIGRGLSPIKGRTLRSQTGEKSLGSNTDRGSGPLFDRAPASQLKSARDNKSKEWLGEEGQVSSKILRFSQEQLGTGSGILKRGKTKDSINKGPRKTSDSEEELELHDSDGNLEVKLERSGMRGTRDNFGSENEANKKLEKHLRTKVDPKEVIEESMRSPKRLNREEESSEERESSRERNLKVDTQRGKKLKSTQENQKVHSSEEEIDFRTSGKPKVQSPNRKDKKSPGKQGKQQNQENSFDAEDFEVVNSGTLLKKDNFSSPVDVKGSPETEGIDSGGFSKISFANDLGGSPDKISRGALGTSESGTEQEGIDLGFTFKANGSPKDKNANLSETERTKQQKSSGGKPPLGNKKKSPTRTRGLKKKGPEDDGFEYVSSDSQVEVEEMNEHFQDDTPSNYDMLNQRYDEDMYPPSMLSRKNHESSKLSTFYKDNIVNTASINMQGYFPKSTNGFESGDNKASPQKQGYIYNISEDEQQGYNNLMKGNQTDKVRTTYGKPMLSEKRGSFAEAGMRTMTPQYSYNPRKSQDKGKVESSRSASPNKPGERRLSGNLNKGPKEDARMRTSKSGNKNDQQVSLDKLSKMESIYVQKRDIPTSTNTVPRSYNKLQGSREGTLGDYADNEGLELDDFGRFEGFVNGMKQKNSLKKFDSESLDRENM